MRTRDGGAVFPGTRRIETSQPVPGRPGTHQITVSEVYDHGLSLRDYFAAAAIAKGLPRDFMMRSMTEQDCQNAITNASVLAYRLADAMLAERNKLPFGDVDRLS